MEGEWSCSGGGHFNGGRMVMLQKWSLYWRENGHTEVVSFMEGMVILQGYSLQWRESGHLTEVVSLREREWSCYGGPV